MAMSQKASTSAKAISRELTTKSKSPSKESSVDNLDDKKKSSKNIDADSKIIPKDVPKGSLDSTLPEEDGIAKKQKPNKKVKVVKIVKSTQIAKKPRLSESAETKPKIRIIKPVSNDEDNSTVKPTSIRETLQETYRTYKKDYSPDSKDDISTPYDKEKLKRAIGDHLIPIDINPLKVTLSKEPPLKKDEDNIITLSIQVEVDFKKVWTMWTHPNHIKKWHTVSGDWEVTNVDMDFQTGGSFSYSLKSLNSEDISEFKGTYIDIVPKNLIVYITKENQKVSISMVELSSGMTEISQSFEPDDINSIAIQRRAWGTLLENFKTYALANNKKVKVK